MGFINPKTDYAFKKIFGSPDSQDILMSFLNAIIYQGDSTISDLEIINPNFPPQLQDFQDPDFNVQAQLDSSTIVTIKMQVLNEPSFNQRVFYHAAKTNALQLKAGEGYRHLKQIIALTITDFEMFPDVPRVISQFVYKEKTSNFKYSENDLELVFVELPKFTKEIDQLETLADQWIYFLKYARSLETVPKNLDSVPEIHKAFEIANRANLTQAELDTLQGREMLLDDRKRAIAIDRQESC